jgi:hypothetical protein
MSLVNSNQQIVTSAHAVKLPESLIPNFNLLVSEKHRG